VKVVWSEQAFTRLAEIQSYIAADDSRAARNLVSRLIRRTDLLARMPNMGRRVPELPESNLRELIERSYRIVYRIRGKSVQVVTVFESHKLFPAGDVSDEPSDSRKATS